MNVCKYVMFNKIMIVKLRTIRMLTFTASLVINSILKRIHVQNVLIIVKNVNIKTNKSNANNVKEVLP